MKCFLCDTDNAPGASHCAGCKKSLRPSGGDRIGVSAAPSFGSPAGSRPTILEGDQPAPGPGPRVRKTQYAPPPDTPGPPGRGGGRKTVYVPPAEQERGSSVTEAPLVGFLVSFTARPGGVFFPIREGRNIFGSDPGRCDGSLTWDRAMSSQHFALMVRRGRVRVRDLESTNATRVDGVEVWGDSTDGRHGSIVHAGDTTFEVTLIASKATAARDTEEDE